MCLPANATHLFKPLAVEDNAGGYSIDKATAVRIACMTWKRCRFATNVQSGFKVCGLYPLSLVNMQHRMDIYTRNGTPADIRLTAWLHVELPSKNRRLFKKNF
ncbi:hypothetical protein PHYSODRAFT_311880 [Phytophthora sojae]|uniref:DDE-1 domain-containing protein n=1 Tax=Phytophthora sojae (strain P6497) TaxID=1094619 RepID=G4YSY8_PHYSP|nr:hypothetical protein PHYSODRAFT_311880 [Phytophthora sojae]EGZ25407.1 hypothetical protein PHYSODRAFT_311880 [Phytophthora sojae]|eukprot:XP_009520695.1 hypothetical protein PHYSODRAFT_311880 [Phytophthora sojae]